MRKFVVLFLVSLIIGPGVVVASNPQEEVKDVRVVNLPETQNIDGSVAVKGLIRHSSLARLEKLIIPPAQRSDTNSLTSAGVVQADGFTSVVLSIFGEAQSTVFRPGTIGAILVPDEKPIIQAFVQDQSILFPLEVKTEIVPNAFRYFSSEPTTQTIGFPRYRVYFYNSTNKSVEVSLYLYLTN